jgi:hypothetical protein
MFWYGLWLAPTGCIVITNRISVARGDKPYRGTKAKPSGCDPDGFAV